MPSPIELPAALATTLTNWFDEREVVTPSINYAVFDRGGVVFQHGIGEFQLDGRTPQVDTVYRIASMSKSFEMAAVLVLAERGLLALDDLVSDHVAEFTDPVDAFGAPMPVTVRMIMSNSSALPEDNGWADHELGLSRDDFLAIIARGLHFAGTPGFGYQYSNIGFWLLGVIVENVSGQSFEDFARTTLLEPLGLADTRYSVGDYPESDATRIAHGFGTFDEGASWFDRPVVGTGIGGCAASMFSTVSDIAAWSGWLSSAFDRKNSDDTVLSRASRRLMQRIHTSMPAPADRPAEPQLEGIGYGLGLMVENDVRFGLIAQHSGGLPGWSSNMRWHQESGIGVVVFANTNGVKPGIAAAGMLRAVLDELDPPARDVTLWPQTVAAATAIDEAVRAGGDITVAESLFSPNLLSDVPADVRASRLATLIDEIGGLTASAAPIGDRLIWATSEAHVAWSITGISGELECRIELTPTEPPMLQRVEIERRTGLTALSSVIRHYRPLV
ncbi:serine hydrolase domain-containing protein [Conyzicola nivalis]|uniref:Penicillin-binding protein n=1 Tax=Conyzicola nivalis TaxID=1477021 RepID=A0A916SEP5_9MICO|nr:serine hydrolase domain-containing protein [Conyzicola nivalis]GGA95448.1 penicillin-binding protein [Conyzicola nivalis]